MEPDHDTGDLRRIERQRLAALVAWLEDERAESPVTASSHGSADKQVRENLQPDTSQAPSDEAQ